MDTDLLTSNGVDVNDGLELTRLIWICIILL